MTIEFSLPFVTESLNIRDRKHWARRSRDKRDMAQEIMIAMGGPRYFPRPPLGRVKVTVVRCSAGRLDADNLVASTKDVLDALCLRSPTHPCGLGIITDDGPDFLTLVVTQCPAAPGQGSTLVRIETVAHG